MSRATTLAATAVTLALVPTLAACGSGSTKTVTVSAPREPVAHTSNDLGGRQPFSARSPWNQRVDNQLVDPDSTRMLRLAARPPVEHRHVVNGERTDNWANLFVNLNGWAPGVFAIGRGDEVKLICRQPRCGPKGDTPPDKLVLPRDAAPDAAHDGWMVLIDNEHRTAWDLWRARRVGNVISYAFARRWSLDQSGVGPIASSREPRTPSVRGSGLPLLGGLIRPSELRAGSIQHALAIAIPAPTAGRFVAPASTTNGLGPPGAVPQGARLRLRAGTLARIERIRNLPPGALTIVRALRTYGAIVVDRADAPTLYAQRNADYRGLMTGNALGRLHLSDFDVIRLGRAHTDIDAPPAASR